MKTFLMIVFLSQTPAAPPSLREAATERRARLMQAVPDGIVIIQSADRSQPDLYEFMVPDTESHDFIYLTASKSRAFPGRRLSSTRKGKPIASSSTPRMTSSA